MSAKLKAYNSLYDEALQQKNAPSTQVGYPLVVKARENTVEGFIAFRMQVCFPQQVLGKEVADISEFPEIEAAALKYATPRHHLEWMKYLITGEDSDCLGGIAGPPTVLLSPRGSAKSQFFTEWISWQIGIQTCLGLALKVLVLSYKEEISTQKSVEIKRIIGSDGYRRVFPRIRLGKRQSDSVWEIDKAHAGLPQFGAPYTVACAGLIGAVASKRAHIIFGDDLIKSPGDIKNPTIRTEMVSNWHNIVSPVLIPGGRKLVLGTMMLSEDIYNTDFTAAKGWTQIIQDAYVDDGYNPWDGDVSKNSYWPDYMALEWLEEQEAPDPIAFAFQYRNRIVAVAGIAIGEEMIFYEAPLEDISEYERLIISSDLSSSMKETACYTVFMLMGKRRGSNTIDVLDCWRKRTSGNLDKTKAVLSLAYDWGIIDLNEEEPVITSASGIEFANYIGGDITVDLIIEDAGQQQSLKSDFKDLVWNERNIYNIRPKLIGIGQSKKLPGDKRERLIGCTGMMQTGKIRFNPWKFNKGHVAIKELMYFGTTTYVDCVDAFTLGVHCLAKRLSIGTSE